MSCSGFVEAKLVDLSINSETCMNLHLRYIGLITRARRFAFGYLSVDQDTVANYQTPVQTLGVGLGVLAEQLCCSNKISVFAIW